MANIRFRFVGKDEAPSAANVGASSNNKLPPQYSSNVYRRPPRFRSLDEAIRYVEAQLHEGSIAI